MMTFTEELLRDFIANSKHFGGMVMKGSYNLSVSIFIQAFSEFVKTGENILDEHAEVTWLIWQLEKPKDSSCWTDREIEFAERLVEGKTYWSLGSDELLIHLIDRLTEAQRVREYQDSYKQRRLQASIYTSNPTIRKRVYTIHGRKCAKCGSTEKLTLDHITPVVKGGENTIENLQVLCGKCNSQKGGR